MTRIVILITSVLVLSSMALLAQPSDFERGRGGMQMSLKDAETVEKVGIIQGIVTKEPSRSANARKKSDDRRDGPGGQFEREDHIFVELYSGEKIDIGTESYWKSKKLNLEVGKSIRFNVVKRGKSDQLMAVSMEYNDTEYDLLDDEGRSVWMKQMSGMGPGHGQGSPPGRN